MLSPYAAVGIRRLDMPLRPKRVFTPDEIIQTVCEYRNLPISVTTSKERTAEKVYTRQLCAFLLREVKGLSLTEIGKKLGGRDHTTAIHAIKTLKNRYDTEESVKRDVINLRYML